MRVLTVMFDLDGILADLHGPWLDWYNAQFGDQLTKNDIHTYYMENVVRPEARDHIYDFLNQEGAYLDLPPAPGGLALVEQLRADGHTIIINSKPVGRPTSRLEKLAWCAQYLPWIPNNDIYIGGRKDRVVADVFIDDDPSNERAYRQRWPQAYLATVAWPYNRGVDTDGTVNLRAQNCLDTEAAFCEIYAGITMFAQTGEPAAAPLAEEPPARAAHLMG